MVTVMYAVVTWCSSLFVKVLNSLPSFAICSFNTAWLLASGFHRWSVTPWKSAHCACLFPFRRRASRKTVACGCTSRRVPVRTASRRNVTLSENTTRLPSALSKPPAVWRRPIPAAAITVWCITRRTTDGGFTSRRPAARDRVVGPSDWRSRLPPRCSLAGDR